MKIKKLNEVDWLEKVGYSKKIYFGEDDLDKGSLVQVIRLKPGEKIEPHHHEKQSEVLYMLNKNGYFIVNDEKIEVDVGDVVVIEPMDKHITVNDTDEGFLFLCFKINFVEGDSVND